MNNKRVLVLTSTFPKWDGDTAPSFIFQLSNRMGVRNDVFVLSPYSNGSKITETMSRLNVYRFKYWFGKKLLADGAILPSLKKNKLLWLQIIPFILAELFAVRRLVKKKRINVIHAHWCIPQGFVAVAYKLLFFSKVKIICTSHGADIYGLRKYDFIKRWVLNRCDRITAVSNALKAEILALNVKVDVKVIPMGVDLSLFNPNAKSGVLQSRYSINGPLLLYVGRLSDKKGVKYLISAMTKIVRSVPSTKLLIVGDGEELESLSDLSSDLGLSNEIVFAGAVKNSDLPGYYADADIFIGPSIVSNDGDTEGFGLVFVESIGSGCYTIATDLPAVADIVVDGKSGFIVTQRSSDEIAMTVLKILSNPKKYAMMKSYAREFALKNYDWEVIAKKYCDLII